MRNTTSSRRLRLLRRRSGGATRKRRLRMSRAAPARAREALPLVPKLELPAVAHYDPQTSNPGNADKKLTIFYLVHQFYPDSYTGTEKFVLTMARTMIRNGHRVKVVTHSGGDPAGFPSAHGEVVFREYDHEGVPVLAYRHKQLDPALSFDIGNADLSAFADVVLARERPDIVHFGHPMRAMEFMQACQRGGVPYIVTLTDFWFICPKGIMLHANRNLCAGPEQGEACLRHCQIAGVPNRLASHIPLLQGARKIVSPSTFLASMMKASLPDLPIEALNHGIHRDPALANRKTYRRGDKLTLFYGGSLNEHKGVHLLLEAMSRIRSNRLRLKIYGSGPAAYTESLRQAAAKDRRVELCGPYAESDIPGMYQQVDVAVVPSVWYENYPLALHEALSYHVPAIVSAAGGMAESVRDGVNGYTFRLGDAGHLAERIRALLANPELLNALKANLSSQPIATPEQEAASYETIYYAHASRDPK